jgi:hypothetical protein
VGEGVEGRDGGGGERGEGRWKKHMECVLPAASSHHDLARFVSCIGAHTAYLPMA